jgi:hypothetical protein
MGFEPGTCAMYSGVALAFDWSLIDEALTEEVLAKRQIATTDDLTARPDFPILATRDCKDLNLVASASNSAGIKRKRFMFNPH